MKPIARRRFLIVCACGLAAPAAATANAPQIWRGRAFGAEVALKLHGAEAVQARSFFAASANALQRAEAAFSLYRDSELTRLNRTGLLRHPTRAMLELIALCERLHGVTGGAFDPSLQALWLSRARGRDEAPARAAMGWDGVAWSRTAIRLTRPGMALTFNGIAQGWMTDRLARIAVDHDLTDLLIDAGEQRAIGPRDWQAGIADPSGHLLHRLTLRGRALATSSPMGTRIGPEGRSGHIIDPRGGGPRWGTVAVSADSAALADGLSTALCVMTQSEAQTAFGALPGCRLELRTPG